MNRARRLDVVLPRVLIAPLSPRLFIFPPVEHATSSSRDCCSGQLLLGERYYNKVNLSALRQLFNCTFFTWISGFERLRLLIYFSSRMFLQRNFQYSYLGQIAISIKYLFFCIFSSNNCLRSDMQFPSFSLPEFENANCSIANDMAS